MEYHAFRWTGSPSEDQPSISNAYAQSPLDLPLYRTSHCHKIHLSTSYNHQLNPMADHPWIHPLQIMHDHPDPMVHLGSHQCTRQPTSVCAACLTHRQTVSGPMSLTDTAAHHSHLIPTRTHLWLDISHCQPNSLHL